MTSLQGSRTPIIVPLPRRDGDVVMTDEEAALLFSIMTATIDRPLAQSRARL
jgi:hypothetical protein